MSRKLVLIILVILASGSIATLISGRLYMRNLTPPESVGADHTGCGFPLVWLKKIVIVVPGNPAHHEFYLKSFLLDIAFWSLIVGAPIAVVLNFLKQRNKQVE